MHFPGRHWSIARCVLIKAILADDPLVKRTITATIGARKIRKEAQ